MLQYLGNNLLTHLKTALKAKWCLLIHLGLQYSHLLTVKKWNNYKNEAKQKKMISGLLFQNPKQQRLNTSPPMHQETFKHKTKLPEPKTAQTRTNLLRRKRTRILVKKEKE
ncbi:hypothetical protein AMTRI_Chr06g173120 [Amborella trichopoda]